MRRGPGQNEKIVEMTFIIILISVMTTFIAAIWSGAFIILAITPVYLILPALQFALNQIGCRLLGMDLKLVHPVSLALSLLVTAMVMADTGLAIPQLLAALRPTAIMMMPFLFGNIIAYILFLMGKSFFAATSGEIEKMPQEISTD